MLAKLIGIEDRVWVCVDGCSRVYAIADEDLERETAEKTASVHFLRFELDAAMKARVQGGARLSMGIDHPNYTYAIADVGQAARQSLLKDLAS